MTQYCPNCQCVVCVRKRDNKYSVVSVGPLGFERIEGLSLTREQAFALRNNLSLQHRKEYIGVMHPSHEGWIQEGS